MDTGNMHKKFGKDCTCGSGDISRADRQIDIPTDRHSHHNTSQSLKRAK